MKVLIRAVLCIGLVLNIVLGTPVSTETVTNDLLIISTMDEMPYGW